MSGVVQSPDPLWPESSHSKAKAPSSPLAGRDKQSHLFNSSPYSIDDAPDFHDPYSDLSLFLSKKIKQEMQECGSSKKWSHKIEDDLIRKITPDFQKQFPHYRLGVAALKKIWEKIAYYAQQIQGQKEAVTQDGKLNVPFFIRENLKAYLQNRTAPSFQPYHYAHQLAMKLSECIAMVDGIHPKLDYLTKMIWSVQRHLLPNYDPETSKSPYDAYDKIDKLIVKIILEISAKEPHIGLNELEHKVKEALHSLHELPNFTSMDTLTSSVSALLAEKLYASSTFHTLFLAEEKTAISHFILRHTALYKNSICPPALTDLTRRMIALYILASGLPKNISKEQLFEAVRAIYPSLQTERPPLNQSVYAFIAAELVLMRNHENNYAQEHICETIWLAYSEAILLPALKGKESNILEIVIWKHLSESEGLLEKLPYRIGQRIEEEIAGILIDNPSYSFSQLICATVQYFERIKDLTSVRRWDEIERKIHIWVIQGDMLCRWIRGSSDSALLKLINTRWEQQTEDPRAFVRAICQEYLTLYPDLSIYTAQLSLRVSILYKYVWYTHPSQKGYSSLDLFMKWHSSRMPSAHQLEEYMAKTVPLIPFCEKTDKAPPR